jgi:UDP-3-O-[3-hydroxymyristoyl] glucosamine N-acyltransferase
MKTARELAQIAGGETESTVGIARVSHPAAAGADALVFAQDAASLEAALASAAGLIFAAEALAATGQRPADPRLVWLHDAKYGFALAGRELRGPGEGSALHPSAVVDDSATLGQGTRVGAGAVIEAGAVLGLECRIGPRVVVHAGVVLGDRCVVQAGAVLGATGFGYVRQRETGEYLLFPQQGTLVLEDDVEIGANTTIDRGALGETRIGRGTKVDNLVHIGHNCRIGRNVVIAAQVGLSGSCVVEDGVVIAGQVGLGDHCHIGPGVVLGGQSGVYSGKTVRGPGELFAGTPAEPAREHMKSLARLRRLK